MNIVNYDNNHITQLATALYLSCTNLAAAIITSIKTVPMELPKDIVLRPRFTLEYLGLPETVLHAYKAAGENSKEFMVHQVDDYVFISIPKKEQHFWSPQLHLEIYKIESQPTVIRGLYGPSPTVWTLFMFFHFLVFILFMASGVWLYTNVTLQLSYAFPLLGMILLFLVWIGLYIAGRIGRKKGKSEMYRLQSFMYTTLNNTL